MEESKKVARFELRCGQEWLDRVREVAEQSGKSASDFIREATEEKLSRQGKWHGGRQL